MCALLVPTTPILDITKLKGKSLDSPEFTEFMIRLTQYLNQLATSANNNDSGEYSLAQSPNKQSFWALNAGETPRSVNRIVVDFGGLPNAGTTSVAHGITVTATTIFTRIYGVANDLSTSFKPLPYSSPTLVDNIELEVDATNVNITTGADETGYTSCYVILEWI